MPFVHRLLRRPSDHRSARPSHVARNLLVYRQRWPTDAAARATATGRQRCDRRGRMRTGTCSGFGIPMGTHPHGARHNSKGETRLPRRCMETTGERCFATPGPTAGQRPGRWVNPAFWQRDARCRGAPFSSRFDPRFCPCVRRCFDGLPAHREHDSSVSRDVAREALAAATMQDVPTYDPTRSKVLQSRYVVDARRKQSLQTGQCSTKGKGVRCVPEHGRAAQCEPVSVPLSRTQPERSFHEQDRAVASAQCASTSSSPWALFDYDEVKTSQHGQSSAKPGWRYSKADTWNEAGYLPADGLRSPRTRL